MPYVHPVFPPGITMLLVDDNPVDRLILKRFLEQHGATVETAESGEEAFNECLRKPYQLVFLNANLPGMDGVNTAAWMRSVPHMAQVPIIILTADSSKLPQDVRQGGSYQMVLVKPITTEGLPEMIIGLLEGNQPKGVDMSPGVVHLATAQLRQLKRFLGPEGLRESLQDYLAEAGILLEKLKEEASKEEVKAIQETAHKLKGTSATVGAKKIAIYADTAAALALDKRWKELEELLRTIEISLSYLQSNYEQDLADEV